MRSLSYLQRVFIGLLVFGGNAAVWAQAPSLEWRTFKVPEYGTRVEYPANIFTAVGEAEKGVGQRFENSDGSAILSDPPPLKWSDLRYVFDIKEDRNGKEAIQA
jgi:hypothetical protein